MSNQDEALNSHMLPLERRTELSKLLATQLSLFMAMGSIEAADDMIDVLARTCVAFVWGSSQQGQEAKNCEVFVNACGDLYNKYLATKTKDDWR